MLITGGTGALGAAVARWLAAAGAEHLVLTGRRGPDAPAAELAAELEAMGPRVPCSPATTGDRDALAAVIAEYPPAPAWYTPSASARPGRSPGRRLRR
nr:hypothetical protein GCM10020092_107000 [Actinoplanes digitatis]